MSNYQDIEFAAIKDRDDLATYVLMHFLSQPDFVDEYNNCTLFDVRDAIDALESFYFDEMTDDQAQLIADLKNDDDALQEIAYQVQIELNADSNFSDDDE